MAQPPVKSIENQFTTAFPRDCLVPLESILCSKELNQRPARPRDYEAENRALMSLAQALSESPRTILQTLADKILEVFQAGSAGLSLLTKEDGGKRFYWPAIAGVWQPHIGGGTSREFGPCGDVLDRNVPLLFRHFERRYPYLLPVTPPAEECLLVPFYVEGKAVGKAEEFGIVRDRFVVISDQQCDGADELTHYVIPVAYRPSISRVLNEWKSTSYHAAHETARPTINRPRKCTGQRMPTGLSRSEVDLQA